MKKIGLGIFALLLKVGPKLLSILGKFAKSFKVGKVGLAAASLASYTYLFTWQFAAMVMTFIFIHESGHVWAMKRCGIKTRGFYFIPFFGGAAVPEEQFPSRKSEFFIAIMGPIWGAAPVLLAGMIYLYTANPLFAAASSWMAMVNLFNLLPINPLDGGRILKSMAFSLHSYLGFACLALGIILSGVLVYLSGMWLFVFLLVIGTIDLFFEYSRDRKGGVKNEAGAGNMKNVPQPMSPMKGMQVFLSGIVYLSIALILWELMKSMKHIPGADIAFEILKG